MRQEKKEQLRQRYRRRGHNVNMKNREFNERTTQQETKLRRYNNHRTNIPPVDRPIKTPSLVQHYYLWHNGQEMVMLKGEIQED